MRYQYISISEITVAILEQGKEAEMSPIGMNSVLWALSVEWCWNDTRKPHEDRPVLYDSPTVEQMTRTSEYK